MRKRKHKRTPDVENPSSSESEESDNEKPTAHKKKARTWHNLCSCWNRSILDTLSKEDLADFEHKYHLWAKQTCPTEYQTLHQDTWRPDSERKDIRIKILNMTYPQLEHWLKMPKEQILKQKLPTFEALVALAHRKKIDHETLKLTNKIYKFYQGSGIRNSFRRLRHPVNPTYPNSTQTLDQDIEMTDMKSSQNVVYPDLN